MYMKRGNEVVPHVLFLIAAAALLYLAGCANQGAPLSVQGKPLSGYVRLTQAQVGYLDTYIGNGEPIALVGGSAGEGQFHWPEFIEGGRLNVGSGVLDYQGRGYHFDVRGLGAAGIGISKIEAKGEVYGLERLRDFPGAYIQAPQTSTEKGLSYRFIVGNPGLWLKNANGVIIHLQDASQQGAVLGLAGGARGTTIFPNTSTAGNAAVAIKMNQ
jgi:hypothetical protein